MNLFLIMDTAVNFCASTANIWQLVGYVLLVFKIAIPILLIVFGVIDLGKAVIASKEDEIKKATGSLIRRAIAAVVIFLLPTIITFLIGLISDFNETAKDDYDICRACISSPNGGDCPAEDAWNGSTGD